jgi:hypothetical protein
VRVVALAVILPIYTKKNHRALAGGFFKVESERIEQFTTYFY